MAKTTIKQITKGDKHGAKYLSRAGRQQLKLAEIERSKIGGLRSQYDEAKTHIADLLGKDLSRLLSNHALVGDNYASLAQKNDAGEADSSFANLSNMRRERQQTLDHVRQQGGGETDLLKAQSAALRNWNVNQQDTQRNYADTVSDINSGINDANIATGDSMYNAIKESDAQQRQAFNEMKSGVGSALGTIIDMTGQADMFYGQARDAAGTQKAKTVTKGTKNQTSTQTQSWVNGGKSKHYNNLQKKAGKQLLSTARELRDLNAETYTGTMQTPEEAGFSALQKIDQRQNMSDLENAQKLTAIKANEGATLRRI